MSEVRRRRYDVDYSRDKNYSRRIEERKGRDLNDRGNNMEKDRNIISHRRNIPYPKSEANTTFSKIERKKMTPLMIRVYCNIGRHNLISDYNRDSLDNVPINIYSWPDCTLRELMRLVTQAYPNSRSVGTRFEFCVVYPNFNSKQYEMKEIGMTLSGQDRKSDNLRLDSTKFQVGDILDVAIYPPVYRHDLK